jgi:hypothetical protein
MEKNNLILILTSSVVASAITFILGWIKEYFNGKKMEEKRKNKIREESYKEVMANIDFIYEGKEYTKSEIKRDKFLKNYRMMFLYSSDAIIKEVNRILNILGAKNIRDDENMKNKKEEIGKAMVAIRREINKETQLTENDFKHVK